MILWFKKFIFFIRSHQGTIDAIIFRELKLKLSKSKFGFLGILLRQLAQIILFLLIFTFIRGRIVQGMDPKLFIAIGFITYQIFFEIGFKSSQILNGYSKLFVYKKIRPFDIIISTTLVSFAFQLIILTIILSLIFVINQEILLTNLPLLIISTIFLVIFSFGFGNIMIVVSSRYTTFSNEILPLLSRPIFLLSGVILSLDRIPYNLHKFLTWNPILQAVELNRHALTNDYFLYDGISLKYLIFTSILVFLIGMFIHSKNYSYLISKNISG